MPLAIAISLMLTRYLRATLPKVSPGPTAWTGGVGSRVWAELPTTDVDTGRVACAGGPGSEACVVGAAAAGIGARGKAACAIFAPPPDAPVKLGSDRGAYDG